jgi:hypothetical protein
MSQRSNHWGCRKRDNFEKPSRGSSRRLSCVIRRCRFVGGTRVRAMPHAQPNSRICREPPGSIMTHPIKIGLVVVGILASRLGRTNY